MMSRNAREGRFLGYSHLIGFYRADGKHARRVLRYRTRIAGNSPTGIAENYREERARLRYDRIDDGQGSPEVHALLRSTALIKIGVL